LIGIEIDAYPLSLDRPGVPDYISRMILDALHRPLLVWDSTTGQTVPGIISDLEQTHGGHLLRLHIDPDAVWSNGRPITASDVLQSLTDAAAHPFWCRFMTVLNGAEVENDQLLTVALSRPVRFFKALLTSVHLAPKPSFDTSDAVFSGSHILAKTTADYIEIAPRAAHLQPMRFVLNTDPDQSLQGFDAGRWDVTSATGVPPFAIAERADGQRHSALTGIFAQLEFPPDAQLAGFADMRRALSLALDMNSIQRAVGTGIKAGSTYGPAAFPTLATHPFGTFDPTQAAGLWRQAGGPDRLVVGYNPYFPNAELITACARQWGTCLGVDVSAVAFPYGSEPPTECDAVLALRFAAFPHPWAVLDQPVRLTQLLTGSAEIWTAAARWLQADDSAALAPLMRQLAQAMPVIPLCEIVGHWIERDTAQGAGPNADASVSLPGLRRAS
jgi:ABC-type transport system substrate-binding protein